jgi:hypothetical protein
MKCKVTGCDGAGKLNSSGSRYFPLGLCNGHYQQRSRDNDNRVAVYYKMVNRCSNPKNGSYKDYGGRGITVCNDWLPRNNGFQRFCLDMGMRPAHTSIDRIDNNAGYSKDNCRWASTHLQNNNRRDPRIRTEDTFISPAFRFRGVSFRKYKYKQGKVYTNKKSHWCASLWVDGQHIRIYCNDRETAIMARLGMEISLLGDVLS